MAARSHPGTPRRADTEEVDLRLPWWALVLPAVAFLSLLMLVSGTSGAEAAESARPLSELLQYVHANWLG